MNRHKLRRGRWETGAISVGLGVLLCVASLDYLGSAQSMAQTSSQESQVGFQSGQVTGKSGSSIQINRRDYLLDKDVSVKDDEGRSRELKDIKEGADVLFHLRRDTIDQLIIVLPK